MMLSFGFLSAQQKTSWQQKNQPKKAIKQVWPRTVSKGDLFFALDIVAMKQSLANAKDKLSNQPGVVVSFPNTNGDIEAYSVWENSNFAPELQAKYPNIRSYVGKGITDKSASINFSVSPLGIETMVLRANGSEFMEAYDRAATTYVLFDRKNHSTEKYEWKCGTKDSGLPNPQLPQNNQNRSSAGQYKTLRLAMPCNGEYAQYFGGTKALALAGMNASMTRINALFEIDLDVHMNFIATEDDLLFTNPETDPFSPGPIGANNSVWNIETQNVISSIVGNAGYDIGHGFFMTGGGGASGGFGSYCNDDDVDNHTDMAKGAGFTSPESDTAPPVGDVFEFDFAAHEFGHQFGANHTFTYAYEGSIAQVEPGSGCTTMGYAGVTGPYDVQPHNIKHFSFASIQQMQAVLATKTCPVSITATNATPVVNAGNDYTIPKGTAFILTATGSDADAGDALTYSWEENDLGPESTAGAGCVVSDQKILGANFVVKEPTASPIRYMPKLSSVLAGQLTTASNWESVSNVVRDLNFRVTVRDNRPGMGETNFDDTLINVVTTSGPLTVTSQNTNGIIWSGGSTKTITWDVNNTNTLAGSSNVNVLLSTDGGLTFPTVLASNVPNNGTLNVTVPNITALACRIMVKPTGNIYYAVNSNAFMIFPALLVNVTGTNPTVNGGSDGSVTAAPSGGATAFDYSAVNTFTGAPFNSNGSPANTPATVSTIVVPALPAGAVVNSATLHLNNVNSINDSFRDEIRVSLTGAYTLAATQISTANGTGAITPDPVVNLPGFPAAGGTINLRFSQTFEVTGVAATIGSANITINYTKNGYTYLWSNAATTATVGSLPAGTYSVTVTDAAGITATGSTTLTDPAVLNYNITATAGANGSISPTAVTTVASGANQTYTITPNTCYQVANVNVDGISQGAITTYTFSNVTANHTISATFASSATTTGSLTTSACDTYTWAQNSQTYTASGTYTNVVGCNTATLTLTINNSTTNGSLSATANNTYTWSAPLGNGQTYTASGTYTSVTTNAAGCPNTATLTLTINIVAGTNWYQDTDGDGFGNPAVSVNAPTAPLGYVANNTDCNDLSALANPNASEILGNGTDDNCDGTTDEVTPTSSLVAASCGATLLNLSSSIFTYPMTSFPELGTIQGYRFRVTTGASVRTYDAASNGFNLLNLPGGATYATTYTVEVSVKSNGFFRAYGPPCTVTTPAIPNSTSVSNPACGSNLANISNSIFCSQVPSASGYRFRVRNGATVVGVVNTTINRFSLVDLGISNIAFGTTYTIDVLLSFGGTPRPDAEYGSVCSITTPATPGTSRVIQPTCGSTINALWTTIFAQQVLGAQGYKFVVTNGAQTREYPTANPRFQLPLLSGGAAANTAYTIRVDVLYNASYVQGTVLCTITTSPTATRQTSTALAIYEVNATPNPYADTFKLNVNTSSEDQIGVRVYDMLGREVEARQAPVATITNLEIGTQYSSGVYNVIVTQGANVKTVRVVKR